MSSKTKNILFRADSSSRIGTGHIMRDLVLASQYKNSNITFATQELNGNINHKIIEAGYNIEILKSNDIKELDKLIKKLEIDMIVIDHYGIDEKKEKKLSTLNSQLIIMILDDTYEKHHCDILLNHNIYAKKTTYKNLVPKNCELQCGAKYTLLRKEFLKEKKKKYNKNGKNIYLAMGGADTAQLNIPILKTLVKYNKVQVNVVTTTANKNLKQLQSYCEKEPWIKLYINSNKIAKLIKKSDFGIITPSVSANELYYLSIPFIAIQTVDNQKEMTKFLKKEKYPIIIKFNLLKFQIKLQKLLKSFEDNKNFIL